MKTPRAYQAEHVRWLLERPNACYSAQPGLGKTGVGYLTHAALGADYGLVVACPRSAVSVWRDEPAGWGLPYRPEVLTGRMSWRWPKPGEVLITTFGCLPWRPCDIAQAKAGGKTHGPPIGAPANKTHLIIDECQNLSSNKSQRHQRARAIAKKCDRVLGLSGTPTGGTPFALYYMLRALHCCPWDWFGFLRRFHGSKGVHGGYEFERDSLGNYKVDPRVTGELAHVMKRVLRVDVASELPPKIITYREIPHRRDTKKALTELDALMAPYYETDELPGLTQFAHVDRLMANERIPHIPDAQKEHEGRGEIGLIFSAHTEPLLAAGQRAGWGVIYGATPLAKRDKLIADFEGGRLQGLAINVKTAATALNLPSADYEIFVDSTWDPFEIEQAEDRANRLSRTKGPIHIEHWVSSHAVCKHRRKVLDRKRKLGADTLGE